MAKPHLVTPEVLRDILDHIHEHITNVHHESTMVVFEHIKSSIAEDVAEEIPASKIFLAIEEWRDVNEYR